jgi:hypothetical protein
MNKSFNYDAQLGGDTDDMELVQRYSLNPELAYTPKINEAIRQAVRSENVQDLLRAGYSEGQALSVADKHYNDAVEGGRRADSK